MDRLFDIMETLKIPGITFSDAFIQRSHGRYALFDNGKFEEISASRTDGTGVRIVMGDRTFFTHSTGATFNRALDCISGSSERAGFSKTSRNASRDDLLLPDPEIPDDDPLERIRDIDKAIRKESNSIKQVTLGWGSASSEIAIAGTENPLCRFSSSKTRFTVSVILEKNGALFTGREVRALSISAGEFLEGVDLESVATEALRRAILMSEALPCPAGSMPVVISGMAGGTMIHEACGHSLEADIILKDFSVFRDSMGKQVASPLVSLADDPMIQDLFGSYPFDGEGTPSKRTILVRDGILESFLTDIHSSIQGDFPRTGNGRRSSYKVSPVPRMSNTFIMNGTEEPESLVARIKKGLLVKKMGGGEVNPTSGDFVFHVTEGYLIKNGRPVWPVKNAILTGSGPQVLMNIEAVGNDLHFESGMCGKSGQNVPVTDGQPSLLIREMTVGGSDTEGN